MLEVYAMPLTIAWPTRIHGALPLLLVGILGCSGEDPPSGAGSAEASSTATPGTGESTAASTTGGASTTSQGTGAADTTGSTTAPATSATNEGSSETGTTDDTDTGVEGPPLLDVNVSVTHTCAVDADGLVYCWGYNALSQLALPDSEIERLTPTWVEAVSGVVQVAVGDGFTLALTGAGQVYCWGRGDMCGNGSPSENVIEPQLMELEGIETIGAARVNACALSSTAELYCWGDNGNGQVTDPTFVQTPTLVAGLSAVAAVAVGSGHRCVDLEAGGVFCWGYGQAGRLGTGNEGDQANPAAVSGLGATTETDLIAAGGTASCASIAGEGLCWGGGVGGFEFSPAPVPGLLDARLVAIGWSDACALLGENRSLRCWGANVYGTLGTGDEESSDELLSPAGLERADIVDLGDRTTCAIDGDSLYCWGDNGLGKVGDGTKINRLVPTLVLLP